MYVITDFNLCNECHCYGCSGNDSSSGACANTIDCIGMNTSCGNTDCCVHGTYCGISNVNIDVDCAGSGNCDCASLGF